jgi:hypothetical protein
LLGLGIGLVVGAGGMYLTLRPPWSGGGAASPPDPVVAAAPPDGGVAGKPKPKRRPGRRGGTVEAGTADGEHEETEPPPLTEADRRLEWRGDDVALPPRKLDMASGDPGRSLDDAEIADVIGGQAGGVRDCVVDAATGADLQATITVKLLVDGNGRVTRSRLHAPRYLFERGVLSCAQRALGRMRFPATGAPTVVTLPVNLG